MDIYKCPFFKNAAEIWNFNTSSLLRRPPCLILRGVPFIICLLFYFIIEWLHYAANRAERVFFAKDGSNTGEPLFAKTGMADFRGCFEYSPRPIFDLCPKNGGSCFHSFSPFSCPLFGGSFVFYKIRLFVWAALSIFSYNIYQTGLKNRCIRHDARIWILCIFIIIFRDEYDYTFVSLFYF